MKTVGPIDVQEDRVMAKLVRNCPKYMRYVSMTVRVRVLARVDRNTHQLDKRNSTMDRPHLDASYLYVFEH